jgi:Zn-dependent metalloprotease
MTPSLEIRNKEDFDKLVKLADAIGIPYIIPSRESIKSKYLTIPSIELDVSKEKILFNKNFSEQQEALHKENTKSLTPNEFREFLKVAKKEDLELYNEITQIKSPWRAEYLDAYFKVEGKNLVMKYHVFENGKIVQKSEILDKDTLMRDKTPGISLDSWLENSTKQGLPLKKTESGSLYYRAPEKDNNSVACFDAFGGGASLGCSWDPACRDSSLGVRAAKPL